MIKLKNILKKKKVWIPVLALIVIGLIFLSAGGGDSSADFLIVERGDLVQEVNFTGRVHAAKSLDMAFEQTGRVSVVPINVGDNVFAGQVLVRLSAGDLFASYNEANANVEAEEARLAELERGSRPEEIEIKEAELAKAEQDLTNYYGGVSDIVNDAYAKADDAVRNQTDALFKNDNTINPSLSFIVNNFAIKIRIESLRIDVGKTLSTWQEDLLAVSFNSPTDKLETALESARDHLLFIRDFLNLALEVVDESTSLSASVVDIYKTDLNTARTNVNSALSSVNTRLQNIAVQKVTVGRSRQELALLRAGTASEQVLAQTARVKQAQAAASSAGARLAKMTLRAPFAGIVTKRDVQVGEIITANKEVISLISQETFEIESFIPEADIAKVSLGNTAQVTLDAYTSEDIFEANVVSIDLAETVVEGVATYKTILQFSAKDERIKSGMTANVDVLTAKKENVISIPQRSVIKKDGKKFVRLVTDDTVRELEVQTGLRGSEGDIEITSGLKEGDRVITFLKNK